MSARQVATDKQCRRLSMMHWGIAKPPSGGCAHSAQWRWLPINYWLFVLRWSTSFILWLFFPRKAENLSLDLFVLFLYSQVFKTILVFKKDWKVKEHVVCLCGYYVLHWKAACQTEVLPTRSIFSRSKTQHYGAVKPSFLLLVLISPCGCHWPGGWPNFVALPMSLLTPSAPLPFLYCQRWLTCILPIESHALDPALLFRWPASLQWVKVHR